MEGSVEQYGEVIMRVIMGKMQGCKVRAHFRSCVDSSLRTIWLNTQCVFDSDLWYCKDNRWNSVGNQWEISA